MPSTGLVVKVSRRESGDFGSIPDDVCSASAILCGTKSVSALTLRSLYFFVFLDFLSGDLALTEL